jgi:hypothetical protein
MVPVGQAASASALAGIVSETQYKAPEVGLSAGMKSAIRQRFFHYCRG